jgi:arginase family enzyme
MVLAHIIGKGAPELVRFWGEPPLVREPDVTLFGLARLDPPEQDFLARAPLRHVHAADIQAKGAAAAALDALAHLHADAREFVLHLDLDVIAQEDFPAVVVPGSGGLGFEDVRAALKEIVRHKNLVGLDVAQFNPDKDANGDGAKKIVDLLVESLATRLESPAPASAEPAPQPEESSAGTTA